MDKAIELLRDEPKPIGEFEVVINSQ